jgi:hypothetical protein
MSLLSQFGRRVPHASARTVIVGPPVDVVPPPGPLLVSVGTGHDVLPTAPCVAAAKRVATALLTTPVDDDLARLEADVDERVDVWTPSLRLHSRHELVAALTNVDDAIRDLEVVLTEVSAETNPVMLEWLATGRFTGPVFLDDDEFVEPTGAVIRVAGAIALAFGSGHRVERIRCYYDRLALLEQVLHRPAPTGSNRVSAR